MIEMRLKMKSKKGTPLASARQRQGTALSTGRIRMMNDNVHQQWKAVLSGGELGPFWWRFANLGAGGLASCRW